MTSPDLSQAPEQSPNWGVLKDSIGFIEEGFPFQEGFPKGASPTTMPEYVIIFRDGQRLRATVDFSTQNRAEGLNWRVKSHSEIGFLGQHAVAAWCEAPVEQE
jgi:hypothetical protein